MPSLSNHCTICSCGQGFTDPSAYTKHRDILGHEKGATHGKLRPTIVDGIKVQHIAGLNLTLETISNPTFVPPPFDASYHLKGMAKPKAQEKYNQLDYVTIELPGPAIPSTTAAQPSPIDSVAKYQEAEAPTPMQTEIQVDKLGIDTNFSYDVVLPQESQDGQVVNPGAYSGCHDPSLPYPIDCPNTPLDDHFVPQQSTPCCYSPLDAAANATYVTNNVTNVSVNATFLPSNPVNTTYIPPNSYSHQYQPFVGSYEQQEYRGAFYTPQASQPVPWSMPLPLVGVSQHDFFQQVGFGMHGREQFQQPPYRQPLFLPSYYPNIGFNSPVYHPAIEAY